MGYLLNQAIDRYLASNSTEIFSTPIGVPTTIGVNSSSVTVNNGDIEELINTTIKAYLLNNPIGVQSQGDIEELVNTTIENKISKTSIDVEGIKAEITELEAFTRSQLVEMRDEIKKAIGDHAVETTNSIAITPTTTPKAKKPKPEGEPDWVADDTRRFYTKLVNDSELLAKVASAIELHPTDNKALAESLVNVGLHKGDGKALDSASMSRIKKVVLNLNTSG